MNNGCRTRRIATPMNSWSRIALARALIEARTKAGLTQAQLAERMHTTQSVIARLEGGQVQPSTRTLGCFAKATGTRLKISLSLLQRLIDAENARW